LFEFESNNAWAKDEKDRSELMIKRLVVIAVSTVSNYVEIKENTVNNKSLDMIEK
jgi:hypothetical protein